VQRKVLTRQIQTVKNEPYVNRGMTLALPDSMLKQLLPAARTKGKVELGDLLDVMKQRMTGTELYARGNPTLNRLSAESNLQSQAQDIIRSIKHSRSSKQGGKQ
jgi:hypothetical protein